jgi:hypothetical protein
MAEDLWFKHIHAKPEEQPQMKELREALALSQETVRSLAEQVMRLGQCVVCGELDEQDGTRFGGKFYCARAECLAALKTEKGEVS